MNIPLNPPTLTSDPRKHWQGLDQKRITFHLMRHAFASRMIHRGISSTVLASLMGHESSTITERRYIHLFDRQRTDEQVRAAMQSATS
jgi:integrase